MGSISISKLLIIVVVVLLIFGTKKLRSLGSDLGASIKGFKNAMNDDNADTNTKPTDSSTKNSGEKSVD